jgi:hypothetical protein
LLDHPATEPGVELPYPNISPDRRSVPSDKEERRIFPTITNFR